MSDKILNKIEKKLEKIELEADKISTLCHELRDLTEKKKRI